MAYDQFHHAKLLIGGLVLSVANITAEADALKEQAATHAARATEDAPAYAAAVVAAVWGSDGEAGAVLTRENLTRWIVEAFIAGASGRGAA